jgi:hypothetical protein
MATSFASISLTPSPRSASWCFLLLEHLDEFATLVWYLLADGKLVDTSIACKTFPRSGENHPIILCYVPLRQYTGRSSQDCSGFDR